MQTVGLLERHFNVIIQANITNKLIFECKRIPQILGNGQRSPLQWIPGPFFALLFLFIRFVSEKKLAWGRGYVSQNRFISATKSSKVKRKLILHEIVLCAHIKFKFSSRKNAITNASQTECFNINTSRTLSMI